MQVLDKGHVELVDHMGSDLSIVNAARVSFAKQSNWELAEATDGGDTGPIKWITKLKASDAKLIHYLASHNHTSPFRHTCISLRIKAPIFVARQLGKHQVGLTWNEVSRRYVGTLPEFYVPEVWRSKPEESVKQGSGAPVPRSEKIAYNYSKVCQLAEVQFRFFLSNDVCLEQARMLLPQSMYTEWIWTGSLQAFFHVWALRSKADAQWEAQQYALAIAEQIEPLFPNSWKELVNAMEK